METTELINVMTKYEKTSVLLSIAAISISILVPLVQWLYREKRKAILKYYPTGHALAYCNLSGSYIRIDGVFEALRRAVSLKKVSLNITRIKDEQKLNLEWCKLCSPASQSFMGLQASAEELAHPFRIDADHVACAFIQFNDPSDSAGKTIKSEYDKLIEDCRLIRLAETDYNKAVLLLKSKDSYKKVKTVIEKELFWKIGEYRATVVVKYADSEESFPIKISVSETQYAEFLAGIEEVSIIQLRNIYGIQGNYQPVLLDIKDGN